ncbi:hypothetical protein KC324_g16 [Hortaea werneckii]|nr:hypothetical protein KC324_g16 [Hortaea werneckii]
MASSSSSSPAPFNTSLKSGSYFAGSTSAQALSGCSTVRCSTIPGGMFGLIGSYSSSSCLSSPRVNRTILRLVHNVASLQSERFRCVVLLQQLEILETIDLSMGRF